MLKSNIFNFETKFILFVCRETFLVSSSVEMKFSNLIKWFLFSGESFKTLRREIEMHFQVRSFRIYYFDDEQQLIFCQNDDDLEELTKLVEQRRAQRNAIRKRAEKPAWFHDAHLIVKDAYDIFDAFDSVDQRDAKR